MADTSKKFFIYNGTLDAFKASAYPTTHTEKIVFIANGGNPVVFHKGMYIESAEAVKNTVAGMKYFNGLTVDGKAYTLSMPTNLIINGTTDVLSVSVNESTGAITLDIASAFKQRVSTLETTVTTLATKTELDDAKADVIDQLVGDSGVDTKDSNTIVGAKLYADDKLNVAIGGANSALIGTSSDSSTADTIWGAKKYGEEKASAAESNAKAYATGLAESAENNAATYTDDEIQALKDGAIKANTDAIAVLNGTGEGSVTKTVADEVAKIVNGAPEDFDTLKEIADYIASDKTGAAEMSNAISANATAITEVKGNAITAIYTDEQEDQVVLQPTNINGSEGDYVYLKAATDELAGVMTAQMHKDLYAAKDTADKVAEDFAGFKVTDFAETNAQLEALATKHNNFETSVAETYYTKTSATEDLAKKANSADVYTRAEIDEMFTTGVLA